ncbi:MAG: ABC transporter permease [Candidatus Rokubacteria bacterium]|nr:ABC transporter permease [Candidatus Rokubacteria bacterium]
MRWLTAAAEWQSRAVLVRHLRVYVQNWYTAFLPPAVEPVLMLLAFGLGVGGYVSGVAWRGQELSYMNFVAPGLLAYAAFVTSVFQSLFSAFIRMRYQRTWEGQLTTQIELRHVVWGEVLWAALLGTLYTAIVALVLVACRAAGLVDFELAGLALVLPIAFVAGAGFAALGLCFTALVPTIDHMNLPVFLVVLPLAFVSGTYFPLTHPALQAFAVVNPLYHLAEGFRCLLFGEPAGGHLTSLFGLLAVMILVLVPLDMRLIRARVLGD